ncbi:hypothetical protein S40288_03697 [Stachybotrys chartarum IBT 40288]|nr:hypothetical protein S40288_03697 [Stachybotrys chartarum IBT 40288]
MRHLHWLPTALVVQLFAIGSAQDIVYVTDVEIYTLLAPCAAYGLTANMDIVAYSTSACDEGESQLHSCVCSHSADFNSFAADVSSSVIYSCGSSASEDLASASMVLDKYCNPDRTITFATPTENIVNAYITELSQTDYLAPCAQSALSYGVMGVPYGRCPEDASLYAPCVCSKSGVADMVSRTLSSLARSSCSNNEDASSAQAFFAEYCAMNQGTTEFAPPNTPPGDMTYYITALPQFSSLRDCAQIGVSSAIQSQTGWLCGSGPQALASCVCIKSGMFRQVSSALTEEVKWQCDNTATADVQSAFEVFEYYCSAAEDLVVAEVSESVSSTINTGSVSARTSAGSSSPAETGSSNSPSQTEGGNQQGGGRENNAANGDGDESTTEASRVAVIAGAVVGSVLFIVGIAVIAFFIRRRRRRSKNGEPLPAVPPHGGHEYHGKPELAGSNAVISRPGTGYVDPDNLKPELPTAASYNELPTPTTPSQSPRPMWPQGATAPPPVPELSPAQAPRPELYGAGLAGHAMAYGQPPQELSSPGTIGCASQT